LVPAQEDRERYLGVYQENLQLAAEVLHPKGIAVLVEPLNPADVPGYLIDSFDLARSIISRQASGIGLQFDAYHATRMGLDLLTELRRSFPLIRHVQFADVPGRHEPGTGAVPFHDLLTALHDARYGGWLGAEYFPRAGTARGLGWLADWRAAVGDMTHPEPRHGP
jgi:hydroxypyruvate isomerase